MKDKDKEAVFSSNNWRYQTPHALYQTLNKEFHFTLDPATDKGNWLRTPKFLTEEDDGLLVPWKDEVVFLNPPWSRKHGYPILPWITKSLFSIGLGTTSVLLIAARTDTSWFHSLVFGKATEVRFIPGRVKYYLDGVQSEAGAAFPSMIVVYRPLPGAIEYSTNFSTWTYPRS